MKKFEEIFQILSAFRFLQRKDDVAEFNFFILISTVQKLFFPIFDFKLVMQHAIGISFQKSVQPG